MELALKVFVYDKKNLSQVLFCMNFLPFIIAETSWYSTLYYQDFVWSWIEELLWLPVIRIKTTNPKDQDHHNTTGSQPQKGSTHTSLEIWLSISKKHLKLLLQSPNLLPLQLQPWPGASLSGYLHPNNSHQRMPSSKVRHRHIYADELSTQLQKTRRAFSYLDDCCLGDDDRQKGISSLHTQPEPLYTIKTLRALLRLQKISTLS